MRTYIPLSKCSSFWTWLSFRRESCGTIYTRICGWDNYGHLEQIVWTTPVPDGAVGEHIKGNVKFTAAFSAVAILGVFLSAEVLIIHTAFLIWAGMMLFQFYDQCAEYHRYRKWKTS